MDSGSVASPYRETEGMLDGSDAIGGHLELRVEHRRRRTWTCFHHGRGVGIGYSLHAGFGMVVDGTELAEEKALRVFTVDPGIGIVRHAHAGYPKSLATAARKGVKIPIYGRLLEKARKAADGARREGSASTLTKGYRRIGKSSRRY